MVKKIWFIALFLCALSTLAQNLVGTIPLHFYSKTNCFEIVDDTKSQLALCLQDAERIRIFRMTPQFQLRDSLTQERPSKEFKWIMGYTVQDNQYALYWISGEKDKLGCQIFDFNTGKTAFSTLPYVLGKEKEVAKINAHGKLYVVSCLKNESVLTIRTLEGPKITQNKIDLTGKTFLNYEGKRVTFWEMMDDTNTLQKVPYFQFIDDETPPSLVLAAMLRKSYIDGDTLIFTFDNNDSGTQLLAIQLTDFSYIQKLYPQPYVERPAEATYYPIPATSFYFEKQIIQLKGKSDRLMITHRAFDGTILKSWEIVQDQEIGFKNTEIIQENGSINSTRVLDKSNQLIRKINNLYPSISCFRHGERIVLTIGGVSEVKESHMFGPMFGLIGAAIDLAINSYSNDNFNSYVNRKIVYVSGVFDNEFNALNEPRVHSSFDRFREFIEGKRIDKAVMFTLGSSLYLGAQVKGMDGYSFYEFKN